MDDHRVAALPIPQGTIIIRYGSTKECDIRLIDWKVDGKNLRTIIRIQCPNGIVDTHIPIPGEFMALNACGAVAVGHVVGIPIEEMSKGLQQYQPVGDRMKVFSVGKTRFINDSYNANTLSMRAALNSLAQVDDPHKIALLGDMLEMGKEERAAHTEILRLAISMGFQIGIVGARFATAANSLGKHDASKISWSSSTSEEMSCLINDLPYQRRTILLKGSRGMKMESILNNYPAEES